MIGRAAAIGAVVVVALVAILAYAFFRTPEEASAPISAIPLNATATSQTNVENAAANDASTDGNAADNAPTQTAAPTDATANEAEAAESEQATVPDGLTVFEIVPAESEARFLIDEVLRGDPITVVGATDQVAGQIAIDPEQLTAVQVGIIQVNARTLATDNEFRNRAIKNRILLTNDYEFITFTPLEMIGLPESGAVGGTYSLQIAGDLTITDVTRSVTFDVTVTPISVTRIEGTASATVIYTDFELFIPDSPSVDTVADEVRLELEFVAEAIP